MKNTYKKYYGTNKRYYDKRYHSTNILKRTNVNNGKVATKWFQINIQKDVYASNLKCIEITKYNILIDILSEQDNSNMN